MGRPFQIRITVFDLGNFASPSLSGFDITYDPAILIFSRMVSGLFFKDPSTGEAIFDFPSFAICLLLCYNVSVRYLCL